MRAVVITRTGGPAVLRVEERADPVVGDGELLVRVEAAGVNFADTMARIGLYPDSPPLPAVVGYEVAGTVAALGPGVEGFAVGDRVVGGTRFGGYAELAVAQWQSVAKMPEGLSFEQAAAIPINYMTAFMALHDYGNLQRGQRVLIHSAGGGVGIAATQLARRAGAEIYGTASESKHQQIREFGVDHPLDYRHKGWHKGLPPFDLVLDAIGGRSFRISYDLLRPGGRVICFGASAVSPGTRRNLFQAAKTALSMPRFNLIKQMSQSKTVVGLNMLRIWEQKGDLRPWFAPLMNALESGEISPVVAATFSFEQAPDAHRYIAERRNVGKVVLTPH